MVFLLYSLYSVYSHFLMLPIELFKELIKIPIYVLNMQINLKYKKLILMKNYLNDYVPV